MDDVGNKTLALEDEIASLVFHSPPYVLVPRGVVQRSFHCQILLIILGTEGGEYYCVDECWKENVTLQYFEASSAMNFSSWKSIYSSLLSNITVVICNFTPLLAKLSYPRKISYILLLCTLVAGSFLQSFLSVFRDHFPSALTSSLLRLWWSTPCPDTLLCLQGLQVNPIHAIFSIIEKDNIINVVMHAWCFTSPNPIVWGLKPLFTECKEL